MSNLRTSWVMVLAALGAACSNNEAAPSPEGSAGAGGGSAGTVATSSGGAGAGNVSGAGSATGGSASGGGSAGSATGGGVSGGGSAGGSTAGGNAGAGGATAMAGAGGSGVPSTEKFSFFVTSMASMLELAKAKDPAATVGFGGDFSYGESGAGAGLRGADKICTALAEKGMPGNNKVWRAFLSATAGEDGKPVNAIDRVGTGPWYDLTGRKLANDVAGLKTTRPTGGDGIADDLPNEFGVPNHQPNPNEDEVDNHDTLTGSTAMGVLMGTLKDTCNDWTSKVGSTGVPGVGHSWPRSGNQSWLATHKAGGCAPGVNIFAEGGPAPGDLTVGAGGGYGGIYCFALTP